MMKMAFDRFMSSVNVDEGTGCWLWFGSVCKSTGYGRFSMGGITRWAHRASYAHFSGHEILEGRHIDHRCRNRRCVNPDHLDMVTPRQNALRGLNHRQG